LMPKSTDLNEMIGGMRDLLGSALGVRAHIKFNLADGIWPAMVDQSQIELLVLNLVINARDAMPDAGFITIETANYRRTEKVGAEGSPPGDYVTITVRDTGTGIAPDILSRVFEPFFTTKEPGSGSGLGLSQVFGTARQSGGEVHIETVVGRGTAVRVDLPRAKATPSKARPDRRTVGLQGSTANILLVDDDDPVRAVTAAMLRDLGYTVRDVAGGEAALKELASNEGTDILLTDLVMPVMNGSQLAALARERWDDLSVVFISGYAEQAGFALLRDDRLIHKPFSAGDLHDAIEAVLLERREVLVAT
jgi:CheY-like chemotaxis protein